MCDGLCQVGTQDRNTGIIFSLEVGKTRRAGSPTWGGLHIRQFLVAVGSHRSSRGRFLGSGMIRFPGKGHWTGMEKASNWSEADAEAEGGSAVPDLGRLLPSLR